jgi:hypothetical protein
MTSVLLALLAVSPLSPFLQEAVDRGDVVGVVALVISSDRVVYHEAFGKQDVGRGIPMAGGLDLLHRVNDEAHHIGRSDDAR